MKGIAVVVLGLLYLPLLMAQAPEERAEAVADKFCTCVNETYSNIDQDVKRAMGQIISYKLQNQPQDLERYMRNLSAELVIRIQEQAGQFKKNGALAQYCIHDMEQAMENIDLEDPQYAGITDERFSVLIQQQLKSEPSCEFAALLMELGLRENIQQPQVRIGQTRSRETAGQ
jgi:hypothetical protein